MRFSEVICHSFGFQVIVVTPRMVADDVIDVNLKQSFVVLFANQVGVVSDFAFHDVWSAVSVQKLLREFGFLLVGPVGFGIELNFDILKDEDGIARKKSNCNTFLVKTVHVPFGGSAL